MRAILRYGVIFLLLFALDRAWGEGPSPERAQGGSKGPAEGEPKKEAADPLRAIFEAVTADRPVDPARLPKEMDHPTEVTLGNVAFRSGRLASAIGHYGRVAEEPYARYLLGCALFEVGRYEEAAGEFAGVRDKVPDATSARMMERLCILLLKDKDAPLLASAIRIIGEARKEVRLAMGSGHGASDPLDGQLMQEAPYGVGPYAAGGDMIREAFDGRAVTPRELAAAIFMSPTVDEKAVAKLAELAKGVADEDMLLALWLLAARRPADATATEALLRLRALEPANGYWDAMLALDVMGRRFAAAALDGAEKGPGQPKGGDDELAPSYHELVEGWNGSVRKEFYRSHVRELMETYASITKRSGCPFWEFMRLGLGSAPLGGGMELLAGRVHVEIRNGARKGDKAGALERIEQCRKVALKVLRDQEGMAAVRSATAIFGGALGALPRWEPAGDEVEENWDFETPAAVFSSEVGRLMEIERGDGLLIAAISRIPAPRLQSEAVRELAGREARIAARVARLIAEWKLPDWPAQDGP